MRGTGLKVINDHLEDVRQGRELKKDILSHVIKSAVVDGNFTMEEMIDEFVTLFVGGEKMCLLLFENFVSQRKGLYCMTCSSTLRKNSKIDVSHLLKETFKYCCNHYNLPCL